MRYKQIKKFGTMTLVKKTERKQFLAGGQICTMKKRIF